MNYKHKVVLLLVALSVNLGAFSQNLNLRFQNVTVRKAMTELKSRTGYSFVYEGTDLNTKKKVTVNAQSVDEAVKQILQGQDATYEIQGKSIIVRHRQMSGSAPRGNEVQQQKSTIKASGRVTDEKGEPVIGATVMEKGTSNGTVTDLDGHYSLAVPEGSDLEISYIGYKSANFCARVNKSVILVENSRSLNEVVVVGYGTQKKADLTGAVASLTPEAIENRPITQTSQALAGLTSGVVVSQSSGRPGGDQASVKIRGVGTFSGAGSDPLVLIDGLSASINDVDPNNIKSISILKDAASAAIYGTRAANGVILIETKRGKKGVTQVSYNGYEGWQKATELPDFLDSWEYATMRNEADKNENQAPTYSNEEILKFKNGTDPDNYPNVNHMKNLVTSGSGFQTAHSVSFTSGGEKLSYLFSLGYLHQDGIVAKDDYSKYNFQLNVDNQILSNLLLTTNLSGYSSKTNEPYTGDGDMTRMIGMSVRENAAVAGRKSDGTYGYQDLFCPEGWLDSNSFRQDNYKNFLGGVELAWDVFKGLTLSGKIGYNYSNYYNKKYKSKLVFDKNKIYSPNNLNVSNGNTTLTTLQFLARYNKDLKAHHLEVLLGTSQEEYYTNWGEAYRQNFPNDLLYELNAGSTDGESASGSGGSWALRSFFGRINYSFQDKYLLEVNARYDGTSRFPSKNRWGLFPSVSLGWRLSEEKFIKDNIKWIDNLKIRASYGKLGNQNIGNYPYQNTVSLGIDYPFGNTMSSGAAVRTLANQDIRWETTTVFDLGLDMTVLNDKFDFVFDFFDKRTSGILYNISASDVLGMTPSEVNAASVKNTGIELDLNYHVNVGKFKLHLSPNFSYYHNEVTSLGNNLKQDISQGLFVGKSLNSIYGYVADGLFVNQADINSYASQPYSAESGFVRYKDISGPNGVPDGKVDPTYDRTVLGSTLPKFSYGLTIAGEYKGFDFSILFQGLGGYKEQMGDYQAYAFYNSGNIQRWQVKDRWTEENPNRNARYIKLTSLNGGAGTIMTSSYWLRNGSFLRAKNLQVGYTIPSNLTRRIHLSRARIYFSGQNLFCINSFYKGWDPELSQAQSFYPITTVYSFGLNLNL